MNSIYIHVDPKCNARWWLLASKEYDNDNRKTNNNCKINEKKEKERKRRNVIQSNISN